MNYILRSFSVGRAVGEVTFREIVRDKILYNMILVAVLLLGMTSLAARLTYVRPERVAIDFGLSAIQIAMAMVAIFVGSGMIAREFERRTIYVALSRPISRLQFITGKFIGLTLVLAVNWALLVLMLAGILSLVGEGLQANFSWTLFVGLVLTYFQTCMLAAIAVFISTFTTTSLAAAMTIGLYLLGNNVSQIRLIGAQIQEPTVQGIMNGIATIVPNLEYFNLGFNVTYALPVGNDFVGFAVLYSIALCSICLGLAGQFAKSKDA